MKARIIIEATFVAELRRLPPNRQKAASTALQKFMTEPQLPGLRMRPLQAKTGHFIIDSAHGDRLILRKDADDLFAAVDVGPHDNVFRRWNRKR